MSLRFPSTALRATNLASPPRAAGMARAAGILVWGAAWSAGALAAPICPSNMPRCASDCDCDGARDATEDLDGDDNFDEHDTDDDGAPNWRDPDDDGDGVDTIDEAGADGNPNNDRSDPLEDEDPDYLNRFWPLDRDHDDWQSCAALFPGWEDPLRELPPEDLLDEVDRDGDGRYDCDCDDERVGVNPGVDFDPLYDDDNWDCNVGNEGEFDGDGDGYDSQFNGAGGDDCNDRNSDIHPGAEEDLEVGAAPRVDRNCDGFTDPVGLLTTRNGCDCAQPGPIGSGGGALPLAAWLLARRKRGARRSP